MLSTSLQKWEGRLEQLVGRVKSLFGELTDNPHYIYEGECERRLGVHKESVAQSLEEFEKTLERRMIP
jgi:uncharacterized protein YjbJ (UPF0337 family)